MAELLERTRWTDVARHLATVRGEAALLRHTGREGFLRVDQFHATEPLVPALLNYEVIHNPHSDHDAILMRIDTDLIDPALVRVATT
ncbi:hypothetical protein ACFOVU_23370 [Nocardiopsis sediminis]|uniref:Uncharacterized protein n=1 Tax=Nocardiopsis sediminis TaxID=1778267 RepID=A0ABV8FW42_9ACTN